MHKINIYKKSFNDGEVIIGKRYFENEDILTIKLYSDCCQITAEITNENDSTLNQRLRTTKHTIYSRHRLNVEYSFNFIESLLKAYTHKKNSRLLNDEIMSSSLVDDIEEK